MPSFECQSSFAQRKMKNASENQEVNGVLFGNYSLGDKVQDFYPLHPKPGLPQETPMKPSQLPNRYPPPPGPPRRHLPFHSPELHHNHHHNHHQVHPRHPPRPPGHPQHPYSTSHASVRRGDGENHHHYQRPRPHVTNGAVSHRQSSHLHGGHHRDTAGNNVRDQREKDSGTVSSFEKRGNIGDSSHVVLRKPVVPPLLFGLGRETVPLQRSDSRTHNNRSEQALSNNQVRRPSFPPPNSLTSTQNQPPPLTLSNGTSHSHDVNHVLLKRRRDSDGNNDNVGIKKQCLQSTGLQGTLHCSTANASSPLHSAQKRLCDTELSLKTSNNDDNHAVTGSHVLSSSHSLKPCLKRAPMGAKQACIKSTENNLVILFSPSKGSESLAKSDEDSMNKYKRVSFNFPNVPNDPKSPSRIPNVGDSKMEDSINQKTVVKHGTNPPNCRKLHRNKRPVIADDITDLFTPDPTTYIVNSGHKTLKVWPDQTKAIADESGSSTSASSHSQTLQEDKIPTTASDLSNVERKLPDGIKMSLPTIILTRCPLPATDTRTKSADERADVGEDAAASERTSGSPSRTDQQSPALDLDLELDFELDLEVASVSSSDSEDTPLVSLQEIMAKKDRPEKGAPSETRPHHSVSSTKTMNFKNSLEQILKDVTESKRARETETELLASCQEGLLRIAEYEEAESREEHISAEQQLFLQRYSLSSSAIRDVPPGLEVFSLEMCGRIFTQDSLQLRHISVTPQNTAQKMLLWSSHAQFESHINSGLVQLAYDNSPCPFRVTRFLFRMLSVHSDGLLCGKILEVLTDIAMQAAQQRVSGGDEAFKVWVPSLADITLVLMNMGAPFVTLFPLDSLRPPFTESDLLEDALFRRDSHSDHEPRRFLEHNCTNIFTYLEHCLSLCPRCFSDEELLLLLTLLCTVSLDSRLILRSRVKLYPVLDVLLKNLRLWDNMIPKMCQALSDLTDDHHNMCYLVQLLPHHRRGKQLRQHLSLSMISKLLDGSCSYVPRSREFQLCDLRPYLSRLKPSSLLRTVMAAAQSHSEAEEDTTTHDQQAYYLCYSLLTLVNQSTNFQVFPAHQKEQLLFLCSELERHVKCHIREGERWLYRSKVKDLMARIYSKWQMMLQKTKPLNGQLYDYWQPLQSDIGSSQDIEEIESSQQSKVLDEADAGIEAEEEEVDIDLAQKKTKETGLLNAAAEDEEEQRRQEEGVDDKDGGLDQRMELAVEALSLESQTETLELRLDPGPSSALVQ